MFCCNESVFDTPLSFKWSLNDAEAILECGCGSAAVCFSFVWESVDWQLHTLALYCIDPFPSCHHSCAIVRACLQWRERLLRPWDSSTARLSSLQSNLSSKRWKTWLSRASRWSTTCGGIGCGVFEGGSMGCGPVWQQWSLHEEVLYKCMIS